MADGPVTIELDIDNGKDDKNLKKVKVKASSFLVICQGPEMWVQYKVSFQSLGTEIEPIYFFRTKTAEKRRKWI